MESFLREGELLCQAAHLNTTTNTTINAISPVSTVASNLALNKSAGSFKRILGVDLQGISGRTIAGDAHFFEDATTPSKVRAYLDSTKVMIILQMSIAYDLKK